MSPLAAGSAIGVAALTVGRGLLTAASDSLSFAAQLAQGGATKSSASADRHQAERNALDQRLAELKQRIRTQLATANIQLTDPVELTTDGLGGIAVAGPHPEAPAIQEALSRDILLERDFNQLLSDCQAFTDQTGQPHDAATGIVINK